MEWWLIKNKIKELLGIKERLYKCEYCGVYSWYNFTQWLYGNSFCCEDCKYRWLHNK